MNSSTDWWRPAGPANAAQRQSAPKKPAAPTTTGFDLVYWALIGFTVILLLAPQERYPVLQPLRLALLSVGVAFLAYGYSQVKQRKPLIELSPDVVYLLLLLFWALMTLPFSLWPGGSFSFFFDVFLKAAIGFILLSHAITNTRQVVGVAWCLTLCAIPLTLTTLSNYASGVNMGGAGERVVGYESGLTKNPNDMALMLNMILPLCIALLFGARSVISKCVLAGIAMLIVMAIIATFSRAGFLTLLFIGACYGWVLRNRPQRILIPVVLVLGLFALPLVPQNYYDRVSTIFSIEEDKTYSAQSRWSDMQVAARATLSSPVVGSGLGMSMLAMNEARGDAWVDVHTVYLQLALDLGFVGLLLFLLLLFRCIRVTRMVIRERDQQGNRDQLAYLAEALQVSLLAFAVSGVFYPVTYNFYFYYFGGLAIAVGRVARNEARENQS